ncbi:hypothetical protein [Bilophila wadsworthia]|uniref:hypothetical protein n=1 Tax=Bilophila wadsworthia TaxID=35833 RepID=UPI00399CA2D9
MLTIKTLQGTHRMSTQDLLLAIEEAVGNGETSLKSKRRASTTSAARCGTGKARPCGSM